jgi:hypothetical protein
MLEVFTVKIIARVGHQRTNEHWPIGAYLSFRPEQFEDVHGPGGWAGYDPGPLSRATFADRKGADKIVAWMADRYPEIKVQLVRFVEAP